MSGPNILVIAVDGLRASSLGAYGNASFPTPALDHLAAESLLFDWCYAPTTQLRGVYQALWHSRLPARSVTNAGVDNRRTSDSLPNLFAQHGYETILVTDSAEVVSLEATAGFHECINLANENDTRAHEVSDTLTAQVFAAAADAAFGRGSHDGQRKPRLVWVHCRGMYGPWDAPLDLQSSLLDDEDPAPVETVESPALTIAKDQPDEIFRYSCAYAAQAMVLDQCVHELLASLASAEDESRWLIVLLGVRGFPLGEHARIGGVDSRLYAEQLHVPWLIRFPDRSGRLMRANQLVSHVDLLPTLLDAAFTTASTGVAVLGHSAFDGMCVKPVATKLRWPWRDALVASETSGTRAIRTSEWCLRQELATQDELFVRPDDRWEANDVAKLCPDVVAALDAAIGEAVGRLASGEPLPLTIAAHNGVGPM